MTSTGKTLTKAQIDSLKSAMNTPMLALQCGPTPSALELVQDYARLAGLPEIPGYYGADLVTGDIVTA